MTSMGVGLRRAALMGGLACVAPLAAQAQGRGGGVGTIGTVTVGGPPALLRVSTAVAGMEPTPRTGTSTITVKAANVNKPQKILVQLSAAMPADMTLSLNMTAPTGATSPGTVALDATARELMGNITNTTDETLTLTYTFAATAAAGVVAAQSRTVTFTITAWP
jgi:hypothetical protein